MNDEEKALLNAPFSDEDDNIDENTYDTSSMRKTGEGNKRLKMTIAIFVALACIITALACIIAVTIYGPQPQPLAVVSPPPLSQPSMEVTSTHAYQDPNNSSQVSALAITVQSSGSGSIDFTQGKIWISLSTHTPSYANVYTTSGFINSSTFNTVYDANFTSYQSVAPNCSIIELNGNGNQLLEQEEQFVVFLNLNSTRLNCPLTAYAPFTVELIPAMGAKLTITGGIPATITPVMDLAGS